jgi:hypothetical protein
MVLLKLKAGTTRDRTTTIIERVLQGILAAVILWVVYRYYWIGQSSPTYKVLC